MCYLLACNLYRVLDLFLIVVVLHVCCLVAFIRYNMISKSGIPCAVCADIIWKRKKRNENVMEMEMEKENQELEFNMKTESKRKMKVYSSLMVLTMFVYL